MVLVLPATTFSHVGRARSSVEKSAKVGSTDAPLPEIRTRTDRRTDRRTGLLGYQEHLVRSYRADEGAKSLLPWDEQEALRALGYIE